MKTLPKLLPFLLSPVLAFSQNWNLISSNSKFNFGFASTDSAVAKTIYVEQSLATGADSVFIVKPRTIAYLSSNPYLMGVADLLGDSVIKKPNGQYEFRFKSPTLQSPFFIHAQAQPGENWVYRDSITAYVAAVASQTVFGVPDSVKTIELSNGYNLLLSKSFGILQLNGYRLIGLQGTGSGVQLPTHSSWYGGWQTGDIYEYYGYTSNEGHNTNTWRKIYVQNVNVTPTDITFTLRELSKGETYIQNVLTNTTYGDVVFPFVISDPDGVQYPGYTESNFFCQWSECYYQLTGSGVVKKNRSLNPPCSSTYFNQTHTPGLGLTHKDFSAPSGWSIYQSVEDLMAYHKNGQGPVGILHPDSFYGLTGAEDLNGNEISPRVFPNPARDYFMVDCGPCDAAFSVELHNAAGQTVRSVTNASGLQISTAGLSTGVYGVKIRSEKGVWSRKLLLIGY